MNGNDIPLDVLSTVSLVGPWCALGDHYVEVSVKASPKTTIVSANPLGAEIVLLIDDVIVARSATRD